MGLVLAAWGAAQKGTEGRPGGATLPRPFAGRAWARCPPAQCCPPSGDSLASTRPFGRRRWVSGGGQQLELRKPRTVPVCPSSCQSRSACFVTGSWPSGHSRTGPKGQSAAGRKSESHRAACVLGPGPPGAHGLLSGRPDPWLSSRWTWMRTRPSGSTTACWSWKRRSRPPCGAQTRRADGTDCPVRSGPWLPLPCPAPPSLPVLRRREQRAPRPAVPRDGIASSLWAPPADPLLALACPWSHHALRTECGLSDCTQAPPRPPPPWSVLAGEVAPLWVTWWLCSLPGPGGSHAPCVPCACCGPHPGGRGAGRHNEAALRRVRGSTGLRVWPLGPLPRLQTLSLTWRPPVLARAWLPHHLQVCPLLTARSRGHV